MSQHSARLPYHQLSSKAFMGLVNVSETIKKGPLGTRLAELVFLRVSQINGCAHCLDMHTKDARAAGETEQRLYVLPAWRETCFYSDRERAALAWAEAVTQLTAQAVPDALYEEVLLHFDEKALVDLTLAIVAINGWNRLAIPFRAEVGSYQPPAAGRA